MTPSAPVRKRVVLGLVGLAAVCGAWAAAPGPAAFEAARPVSVAITVRPVPLDTKNPAQATVGSLAYLGGLHVMSDAEGFGGYSGLRVLPDGRLLAISDRGHWLAVRPVKANGRLVGLRDGMRGPLLDEAGAPLAAPDYDAEGLEVVQGPAGGLSMLVSFERNHRIWRYSAPIEAVPVSAGAEPQTEAAQGHPAQGKSLTAALRQPPQRLAGWLEGWPGGLPGNGGIEAMAVRGDGAALLLAEDTSMGRFRRSGDAPWSMVKYQGVPDFKPTDAVFLPVKGRHLALVLSRHFSLMDGVAATLELVDLDTVGSDGSLAGKLLARLAPPLSVDNMEALAVAPRGDGWDVYVMADNNQNPLQRTLLLKFALPAAAVPAPVGGK